MPGIAHNLMRKSLDYSLFVNYEYSRDGQVPRRGDASEMALLPNGEELRRVGV
jgi:hypothetical protein